MNRRITRWLVICVISICSSLMWSCSDEGEDAIATDDHPLHAAARDGDLGRIENLVRDGADVNGTDTRGETPLMVAAGSRYPETVELLLSLGASPELLDSNGDSALMHAVRNGNVAATVILLGLDDGDIEPPTIVESPPPVRVALSVEEIVSIESRVSERLATRLVESVAADLQHYATREYARRVAEDIAHDVAREIARNVAEEIARDVVSREIDKLAGQLYTMRELYIEEIAKEIVSILTTEPDEEVAAVLLRLTDIIEGMAGHAR